jgi:hypothetical protein
MNLFKNLIFVIIFIFFISILIGKENESTNPTKPMIEALKLSAYDSALDKINYDVPYEKIRWAWKDDPQRQEKRLSAVYSSHFILRFLILVTFYLLFLGQ